MPELSSFSDLSKYVIIPKITVVSLRQDFTGWKARRTMQEHQLVLLTKGKGIIDIDNQKHLAHTEDLLYLPCGSTYWKLAPKDCDNLELMLVQFSYALLENNTAKWLFDDEKNFAVIVNPDFAWHIYYDNNTLPFPPVQTLSNFCLVKTIFEKLLALELRPTVAYRWEQQYLLSQLIYEIIKNVFFRKNSDKINTINQVLDYIRQNYQNSICLDDLIIQANSNVSKRHFISFFQQYTSYTPIDYLNNFRIERAKTLLTSTNMQISAISQEVGFQDEFYFSRMFKKRVGIAPSKYRKILLAK